MRVLGVENIGKVSYTGSIISYFILFAGLGVSSYAVREGAKVRDNKEKLEALTTELFSLNCFTTAIAFLIFIILVSTVKRFEDYTLLFYIQGLTIFFVTLSVDWINSVFEDYLFITLRSIASYMIGLLLIFCFIKSKDDYYRYAGILIIPSALVCLSNWFYCRRYVPLRLSKKLNIKKHLKPTLVFFANNVAVQIYVNIDTTMLGWQLGNYYVGIYTIAVKIYSIIKNMLAAIYTVAIPRLTQYSADNNWSNYRDLYSKLFSVMMIIMLPISAGLIMLSKEIVLLIGGEPYIEAVVPLQILGASLVFAIFGGLVTMCLNVPIGKEKDNLIATILSAIINTLLNVVFIPLWGPSGAAITTLCSELFVFVFCLIRAENKQRFLDVGMIKKYLFQSIIGIVIVIIVVFMTGVFYDSVLKIVIAVVASIILYLAALSILKNEFLISFSKGLSKRSD